MCRKRTKHVSVYECANNREDDNVIEYEIVHNVKGRLIDYA